MDRDIDGDNEERDSKTHKTPTEIILTELDKNPDGKKSQPALNHQIYVQLPNNQPIKEKRSSVGFVAIQMPLNDTDIATKKQYSSLQSKELLRIQPYLSKSSNQLSGSNPVIPSRVTSLSVLEDSNSVKLKLSALNPFIKTLNDRSSKMDRNNPILNFAAALSVNSLSSIHHTGFKGADSPKVAKNIQSDTANSGKNGRYMKTKKSNAYEGVLDRLRTTYSSSEDARDTSTEKSENPEEIIQEKGMLLTPGPAFRPRKYSYVPPEDTTRSEENGKKLNLYLSEKSRMSTVSANSGSQDISNLINDQSVAEFGALFDTNIDGMKNKRVSVYTIDIPLDYIGKMKSVGIRRKTFIKKDILRQTEKSSNIPDSLPLKVPSAVTIILERGNSKTINQRKRPIEFPRGSNAFSELLPVGKKEYLEPGIIFAEKQMEAWERMKKETNERLGTAYHHKFKKMADIIRVVQGLRQLGMNPNLLNRVDKSTLNIVIRIKLWKKRVLDNKANEPIRKYTNAFDKDMAKKVPTAIKHDIKVSALSIVKDFEKKYRDTLGSGHLRTANALKYFKALKKTIPFIIDIEIEEHQQSTIISSMFMKNSPKKIYPTTEKDIDETREMESVIELPNQMIALKSHVLPHIVRTKAIAIPRDDVLVEIDEEEEEEG